MGTIEDWYAVPTEHYAKWGLKAYARKFALIEKIAQVNMHKTFTAQNENYALTCYFATLEERFSWERECIANGVEVYTWGYKTYHNPDVANLFGYAETAIRDFERQNEREYSFAVPPVVLVNDTERQIVFKYTLHEYLFHNNN